ncbi:MAG TPA: hypothetical protein VMV79_08035 [Alphaproteobacteria bacterium]|nr:hypothetical protein [Alphaproteobacteria bacterium]
MSPAQAILAGGAMIAASILFVNMTQPAHAQMDGPFQLMHHSNPTANAGVFRIDEATGAVSYCFVDQNRLQCTASVR